MKLHTVLITLALLIGFPAVSIAGITLTDERLPLFDIQGVITKSDLYDLEKAVEVMIKTSGPPYGSPYFRLNSEGGDVEVAIAIGRQLRRFQAQAITFDDGKCLSSCVFILAGAVRRSLSNSIGIHRPYLSSTDQRDYRTTQATQRKLSKLVKDYLEEMNVSPSLYDAMVVIPPEKVRLLSESELQRYGLLDVDPVQQELEDSAEARRYGLSKIDYLTRKSEMNATCVRYLNSGAIQSYVKCRDTAFRLKK
jgi:ATP-dependent protease ClpP protease subunit